jgi:tetracycline repressor-like protein
VVAQGIARAQQETGPARQDIGVYRRSGASRFRGPLGRRFSSPRILESQRHPELRHTEPDALTSSRLFLQWAVNDAIRQGELSPDTDVSPLVEMLIAVPWGMGFYAGFISDHDELRTITDYLHRLLTGTLWQLNE